MKRILSLLPLLAILFACNNNLGVISVTGISISPEQQTLIEGEELTLKVTVFPSEATDKTISWSSSNTTVATVSNGKVKAVSAGQSIIKAVSNDGGFQAVCNIVVESECPALVIDPGQNLNPVLDETGDTVTVTFNATESWTVSLLGSNSIDWVKVEPSSGYAGAHTVTFAVSENTSVDDRTASFRIQSGKYNETVVINQKQKDDITLTASSFELSPERSMIEIEVKSNIEYEFQIDADWIHYIDTKTYESRTLIFEVNANESWNRREGTITFTGGGLSEAVKVYQDGETPSIVLSMDEYVLAYSGGDFSVIVRSNVDVAVEMPTDAVWLHKSQGESQSSNTYWFEADPNPEYEERVTRILFTNRDNGVIEVLTVIQEQKDGIILTEPNLTVPEKGGVFEIEVNANVDYEYQIEGDWIQPVPGTRGLVTSTISFVAEALPEDAFVREARIVFTYSDDYVNLSETQIIRQTEESPVITFNDLMAKGYCVSNYDRNDDGELSEKEAAAVTELKTLFMQPITSFDELRYFTGITKIPDQCFNWCTDLKSVTLPAGLKEIGYGAFAMSGIEGELCLPEGLVSIGASAFSHCSGLKGSLIIPEGVTFIGDWAFNSCSGFSGDLVLPSSIQQIDEYAFSECENISRIIVRSTSVPTMDHSALYGTGSGLIYVPNGRASDFQEAEGWHSYKIRITEEGHRPYEFYYTSSDYSRDGEVVCLQRATKGKGINIVFIGDGFVDKDMAPGGRYETLMRGWMEQFFVYEPYTTFRDWFTVYAVKVVSPRDIFISEGSNRRLTRDLTQEDEFAYPWTKFKILKDVCDEYAERTQDASDRQPNRIALFFNVDNKLDGMNHCSFDVSGYCLSCILQPVEEPGGVLNHELGGHGFGHLGDEYTGSVFGILSNSREWVEFYESRGIYQNLDWRSDPSTVHWSHFLNDPRYANEGLGVYEGAGAYPEGSGLFRPSWNSTMRDADAPFNAPCRELIYKQIMKWGIGEDWEYDYEEFVAADEAGRRQAAEYYAANPPS
ncbi:MAG: leucine-rich repeat protein [Bacteroidales bacterium]|nr:leucine-rich repeat protein [Bacteroidales bacterium]